MSFKKFLTRNYGYPSVYYEALTKLLNIGRLVSRKTQMEDS